MNTPDRQEVFAGIYFLEPGPARDEMSEGIIGHLLPGYPEAQMRVIEQQNLFRTWLVTDVRLTAGGPGGQPVPLTTTT
jgi:hypothetical protein